MLIQFRFQNFKSFRDDTILDFSATKITEHSEHIVLHGNEKLLPVSAIFGANASGKSNVVEAFRFMTTYVVQSFMYGGDGKKEKIEKLTHTPFLFDATSQEAESSFEVYFTQDDGQSCKTYNYGFTLNRDGIVEEWLNTKARTARNFRKIFYRNALELELEELPSKMQENLRLSLEKETLISSLGAKLKISVLKIVRDWFYNLNFADFSDPIENMWLSRQLPSGFWDKEIQKNVISYLSAFDPSIIDFHVEKDDNDKFTKVEAIHRNKDGGIVALPLELESSGTLKMFALYPAFHDTLENGSILVVDELNARLHPLLVRSFLLTFLNPQINMNHAQILFTTHDAWQLSNNLLRRDEIWFVEKNGEGASSLYSLADFEDDDGIKIRKDENYEKNYLLGKYGAIPTLKYFDMFGEDNNAKREKR